MEPQPSGPVIYPQSLDIQYPTPFSCFDVTFLLANGNFPESHVGLEARFEHGPLAFVMGLCGGSEVEQKAAHFQLPD